MGSYNSNIKFILDEFGNDIFVNGKEARGYLEPLGVSSSGYYTDQLLSTNYDIKAGDIVEYQDCNYIAVKQITIYPNFKTTRLRQAIWNTNFWIKEPDNEVYSVPSYYKTASSLIVSGETIDVVGGKIVCVVQSNDITNKLQVDDRFIKFGNAWKITGFNKTEQGLIYINADMDSNSAGDDFENELPDGAPKPKVYTISLEPDIESELKAGIVYSYSVNVYLNGEPIYSVPSTDISFTSSNANVSVVYDENSKKWNVSTSLSVSNVILSVVYKDNLAVYRKTVSFVDYYEIKFNGLPQNINVTDEAVPFTLSYYKNGQIVSSVKQSDYSVIVEESSKAEVTFDGSSYYFKPLEAGYCTVKASMNDISATSTIGIISENPTYTLEFSEQMAERMDVNQYQDIILVLKADGIIIENVNQRDYEVESEKVNFMISYSTERNCWRMFANRIGSCNITATYMTNKASVTKLFYVNPL